MTEKYLDEYGEVTLARLNKEGIFPSPYNFAALNHPSNSEYIIHDSTLREGEQTPGVVFSIEDKKRIAEKLDEVGIQQIEAGFPVVSERQRKSVKALVKMNLNAEIICFSRAKQRDIDAVAEAGADGIVVSFSISQYHRRYKFHRMSKEKYLNELDHRISYAKSYGLFVVYGAEDSTRESDLNFLKKAFKTAEEAGADRVRVVDTLGCVRPSGMAYLVREIGNVIDVPIEVHCHNDLGLALANCLAAIEAGATTISTSVNGIGERSGITSTEEVITALKVLFGISRFDMGKVAELSKLVENITGLNIAVNKPIIGENACTHGSGIHQHGVFMNPVTYESFHPKLIGRRRKVCINELCGTHGVLYIAERELGMNISKDTAQKVLSRIKTSYSHGVRRSAYTPSELKRLIMEVKSVEVSGHDNS
ncbi:MAG: homoaconitate hydratase [Candidatus Bathyarchaeota archaeon]